MSPDAPREKSVHGIPENRDSRPLEHPTASDGTMEAERPPPDERGQRDEFDRAHRRPRGNAERGAYDTQTNSRPSEPDLVDPTEERE